MAKFPSAFFGSGGAKLDNTRNHHYFNGQSVGDFFQKPIPTISSIAESGPVKMFLRSDQVGGSPAPAAAPLVEAIWNRIGGAPNFRLLWNRPSNSNPQV